MATAETCAGRSIEGVIRGTNFSLSGLPGQAGELALVQRFEMNFQRKFTRVYDLVEPRFYYVEGPSEGQIAFTHVVGPAGMPVISCTCEPSDIVLDAGPEVCYPENDNLQDLSYTLKNALPFGYRASGDSNNFLIVFGISYLFSDIQQ